MVNCFSLDKNLDFYAIDDYIELSFTDYSILKSLRTNLYIVKLKNGDISNPNTNVIGMYCNRRGNREVLWNNQSYVLYDLPSELEIILSKKSPISNLEYKALCFIKDRHTNNYLFIYRSQFN